MKDDDVSIVILNYNDYETTMAIIELINNYKDLNHIIIVDNNSSDDSYNKLKKYQSNKIDVIKNERNGGYAQGNNFGVKYALKKYNSNYIIISNPDVIFENKIIKKMINEFEKDEKLGIVSPKVAPPSYITFYKYNYFECLCSMFLILSKIKRKIAKRKYGVTNFFPGSFFMIDSNLFKDVDFFDENTFLYCEEIILNKKIRKLGKYPKIFEDFSFIHNHSVTVKKEYKSLLKPYKIYIKSLEYYMNEYLKINFIEKIIFKIISRFSYIERYLADKIKNYLKRKEYKKILWNERK